MEAETTGTRTGVVDMEVVVGEAEVMEESVAGGGSSADIGRTGTETEPMTETERDPGTERETGAMAEGINHILKAPTRATTLSTRGHTMTATEISQVMSVFIWTIKLSLQTFGNVQQSYHVLSL